MELLGDEDMPPETGEATAMELSGGEEEFLFDEDMLSNDGAIGDVA